MPRTVREWPTRATWVLEDVKAILMDVDALAREAQIAARDGNDHEVIIVLGDVRNKAITAFDKLTRAKAGDYD